MSCPRRSPLLAGGVRQGVFCLLSGQSPATVVQRHVTAYRALQSTFGHLRLSDISPLAIERYKRQRKQDGVSEVTINRELAFLKNLFHQSR